MFETFQSLAAASPRAVAVIDAESGVVVTRETLAARAKTIAAAMRAEGLRAGDLYTLQLPNSAEFVATFLAALELRLVVIPVDRDAPENEVASIARHFRVMTPCSALPHTARLVKLTSGSTGKPKGIVTTEENLVADCENICASMAIAPSDINLGAIPFSHSYGFSNLVMPLLVQGTAIVATNDYLPQSLLELANRYRCTVAPLIPMVFAHLTSSAHGEFETVRTFISAGAPLPAGTSMAFRERFGIDIHSFYGCSECGGITYDRLGGAVERGTVGAPLVGVTIATDSARLSVSSKAVAAGYLHDASTFQPIAEGTFVTDDIVEQRGEELALTGRASDMINTAGKKVNPREVEAVILEMDGVREAKVYGEPAGARGEVVAAAIVAGPEVTREQIRAFCRARLSLHKVPRIVKLIDTMPVDERGKIRRAALTSL